MSLAGPVAATLFLVMRYPSEYTGADGPSQPVPRMPAAPSAPASRSEPVQPSRRSVLPSSPEGPRWQSLREAAVLSPLLGDLRKTPPAPRSCGPCCSLSSARGQGEGASAQPLQGRAKVSPRLTPPRERSRNSEFRQKIRQNAPSPARPLKGSGWRGSVPPFTPPRRCCAAEWIDDPKEARSGRRHPRRPGRQR